MMTLCRADAGLDCSRVTSIMPAYRARVTAFQAAAQREQAVYAAERAKF